MIDMSTQSATNDSSMELQEQYEDLFESVEDVVEASPENIPELFTLFLALPPFREYLNRQDLLTAAVVEAKKLAKEAEASMTSTETGDAAIAGGRPLNVQQLMKRGPGRA